MRQCNLEKVTREKGKPNLNRTGDKLTTFLEVDPCMEGALIELKEIPGLWVIDDVGMNEIETHKIKKNYHVGIAPVAKPVTTDTKTLTLPPVDADEEPASSSVE